MEGVVAVMVNNNNNNRSSSKNNNEEEDEMLMELPPGFRFHPTDEEIITHYLTEKVVNCGFSAKAIGEVDMNKCEPWDLPKRAKMGEKEWFFFCQRDRKYPTGMRTNRATESGYWKATGKDKEIFNNKGIKSGGGSSSSNNNSCLVGMKKTLVFYKGRAPKGEKTNWVMHEYRLEGRFSYYNFPKPTKDEWVVCRVFHKNNNINAAGVGGGIRRDLSIMQRTPTVDSFLDHILNSPSELPPLMDLHEDNRLLPPPPPLPPGGGGGAGAASGSSAQLISEEDDDEDREKFTQEESNFLMPNYSDQDFKNSYQLDMMMMMMRNNNNSMVISPSQEISSTSTSTSTSTSVMKKIGRNPSRTLDQLGQELDVLHHNHNQGTVGNNILSDLDSLWDYRDY